MAKEKAPQGVRSWRQGGKGKARARAAAEQPAWQQRETGKQRVRAPWRWSKSAQVGVAGTLFLVLIGLLIWVSAWLMPPRQACLVLLGAGYQDNLLVPPNVYGWQTLVDLANVSYEAQTSFVWGSEKLRVHQEPSVVRSSDSWAKIGDFPEQTVVFFLALHGGADPNGAYLLPNDATADAKPGSRIYLSHLLEQLQLLPADRNKLVILDATQMTDNWTLGMLENEFVRALKRLAPQIEAVPNLVILSASDVDQRSWVSRLWKQTVFGHFVVEGLKGAAMDDDNDGRIDALELYKYARPGVQRWARDNRDALQTPVLLPEGREGERRARRMDLTVVRAYDPPTLAEVATELPQEVTAAWERYSSMARALPPPYTFSPTAWREYEQRLLRMEELVRAGDLESATNQANKLRNLEQQIEQHRLLSLNSFANTLAMPVVAGEVPAPADTRLADFNLLWDAPPTQYGKIWTKLQAAHPGRMQGQLLRVQLFELLLQRLEKGSLADLNKAVDLLHVLDDPISPRPAEIHYLALLQRDLPPQPAAEYVGLVQLSLRVRAQAERAALAYHSGLYSYSGVIWPWIQDLVGQGDESRRLGQDLLLASAPAQWQKASEHLKQAQASYHAASQRADALRQAIAVRNRVLAGLPYYSHWLARRPAGAAQKELTAALGQIEKLWDDTYVLGGLLHSGNIAWIDAPPPPTPGRSKPLSISAQAQVVSDGFDGIESLFLQYCRSLATVDLPSVWRDVDDALQVPFPDVALRQKLLTTMTRTSRRLLIESQGRAAEQLPTPDYDAVTQARIFYARRQGKLALDVLGQRWFDACKSPTMSLETYAQVQQRLDTFSVQANWWESLDQAGWQIGERWQQLPVVINKLLDGAERSELQEALVQIQQADALARTISPDLGLLLTGVPAERYRSLMVERLLLAQAERTLHDHYFALNTNDEPYYRTAGNLFADDAQRLENRQTPRKDVDAMRQRLKQPGQLVFAGAQAYQWTTEPQVQLDYRLQPAEGAWVPSGFPVIWVEPGQELTAASPAPRDRLVRQVGGKNVAEPLQCTLTSASIQQADAKPPVTPRIDPTQLNVYGIYRGQRILLSTKVNLFMLPTNTWYRTPLPQHGSVSVRAANPVTMQFGESTGALAIVLDVSGSMGPPEGVEYGPTTKYNEATVALRRVLARVPKGTTVSLWVFGQAIGAGKTTEQPEETIRQIQTPVAWDPENTAQLDGLMKRVEYPALEPWNESPIVATMLRARADLVGAKGFKTLLVITDGMDNRFEADRTLNPKGVSIPTELRQQFGNTGIMINVVGFKVVAPEEKKAREQFMAIEQLPVPGRFYSVNDVTQLDDTLQNAMAQQLHYWIDSADNLAVPGLPRNGLNVTQVGNNAQWFTPGLAPAVYKVRVLTDQRLSKEAAIGKGDLLLIDLVKGANGLEFERSLYGLTDYPGKPSAEQEGWRLGVLQNQQLVGQAMQLLLILERTTNRREVLLQMLKPRLTWIEVTPEQAAPGASYAQRWGYRPGYPAPAWSVDVPKWVTDAGLPARPRVRVWWNPDQETTISASLDRGADFETVGDLAGKTIQVDGDPVTIQQVAVEEHFVEVAPGRREQRSCLVVRLHHAQGKPVWVDVQGLTAAGAEHRFFSEPACYSGLFWFDDKTDPAKALSRMNLLSVALFKRQAEQRKFYLEMDKLGPPAAGDIRPPPPVSLK